MSETPYFAHPTAVIDTPCKIGVGTKIWHFCHLMPNCEIGDQCVLGQNVMIASGVVLGNGVKVQNNVSIYKGVICEDEVFLGPSMVFTNVINPRAGIERKTEFRQTIVRKGVSIGANATIICGCEIGTYAFVGAGAVVTKDIKPYALVVGNPARQTGWMSEYGLKLDFNEEGMAKCIASGEYYHLKSGLVSKVSDL